MADPTIDVVRLPMHPRLGRHVRHDSRSLGYAVGVLPRKAIKSVSWERRVPVFDQGQLGSCTGNAAAGWVGTDNALRKGLTALDDGTPVDEQLAVALYSEATRIDPYPGAYKPTDTGSDGLSVTKALVARKLVDTYAHAFSLDALYSGLQSGPMLWGTSWYNSMFDTEADGHVKVDLRSGLAGGHELNYDELEVDTQDAVQRIWFTNSWDTTWGVKGRAYITPSELAGLKGGDFTAPHALVGSPPVPTPDDNVFSITLDDVDAGRARHLAGRKYKLETPTDVQVGDYLSGRVHTLLHD